jgi:aminoglycoside 3-N-acetyltransferase
MLIPEIGPRENGLSYGQSADANLMAQFFHPNMPVDRLMGAVPEALRKHPQSERSRHPILSFVGIHAWPILETQTIEDPLKPIEQLLEREGWVLLLGVDHDVNTSIHYAERLAGRKQFIRWALVSKGVIACPNFPGCSDGFLQIAPHMAQYAREELLANGRLLAMPLNHLIEVARTWIQADPLALLCDRSYCERCETVRVHARAHPNRITAH